jgi:tetratricopeptide (TPR) repeat protein
VESIAGLLYVSPGGVLGRVDGRVGSPVRPNDRWFTTVDSRAWLHFYSSPNIQLDKNTQVEIYSSAYVQDGKHILCRVINGQLRGKDLPPNMRIQTLHGFVQHLGTEFDVSVVDEVTTVTVLDGSVEFYNGRGHVVIPPWHTSTAVKDGPPSRPVRITGEQAELMVEWTYEIDRVIVPRERFYLTPDRRKVKGELSLRRRLLAERPNDPSTRIEYGDALFDDAQYADALERYQEAAQMSPHEPVTLLRVGYAQLELGGLSDADATFRTVVSAGGQRPIAGSGTWAGGRIQDLHSAESAERPIQVQAQFAAGPQPSRALQTLTASGLVGLAWVELSRRHPDLAERWAREAMSADSGSVEAHVVLGLALMRQPRKPGYLQAAKAAFLSGVDAKPFAYQYQALSWLAMTYLAENNKAHALMAAKAAVSKAPDSALAHGNLAQIYFFSDSPTAAEREARASVSRNPDSVSARIALGQALLAEGNVDKAVREAARAVALDPGSSDTHYLLGAAALQHRDYRVAARQLQQSLDLMPKFLPAASALVSVQLMQGEDAEAQRLAQRLVDENPSTAEAWASLGRVYWRARRVKGIARKHRLKMAEEQYRGALRQEPEGPQSLPYHVELAQVYLDENDLPDALTQGLDAVKVAPGSSEAHAVLGLIYDRRSSLEQAVREYREALSLSPDNSLALLGLGTSSATFGERVRDVKHALGKEVSESAAFSTADTGDSLKAIAQAMLRDPAVVGRIFKPGVVGELTPGVGSQETHSVGFTHRDQYELGKLHDLTFGNAAWDENYRNDRPEHRASGWVNLTASPNYRTHILGQYVYTGRRVALPGAMTSSPVGDRSSLWDNSWDLSTRYQYNRTTFLWIHAADRLSNSLDEIGEPLGDRFRELPSTLASSRTPYRQLAVESRVDHNWGGGQTTSYVLFAGSNDLDQRQLRYDRTLATFTEQQISVRDRIVAHTLQHEYRLRGILSLTLGFTAERLTDRFAISKPGNIVIHGRDTFDTRWFPYEQATYLPTKRDLIRLTTHKRRESGFSSVLQPAEALQTSEFPDLTEGGQTTNYQFDYEHRFSRNEFGKLFLFRAYLKDFVVSPTVRQSLDPLRLSFPSARLSGVGVRYERQMSDSVSTYLRYTHRNFVDTRKGSDHGRELPMNPHSQAVFGLSYIDRAGNKLFLEGNWNGRTNTAEPGLDQWQSFPGRVTLNLRFGREPSVDREWVFTINDLFNTGTIFWPGFPTVGRLYRLQYNIRF